MSNCKLRAPMLAMIGAFALLGAQADAAIFTFDFDTLITGDPPGGSAIATMTIEDAGADSVLVTLNHNSTSAAGQFITGLWFNVDPFVEVTQSSQTPVNKFDGPISLGHNSLLDAGLNFDLSQAFQTSNAGGGANRLNPGESVSFMLSGSGVDAADFVSTAIPNGGNRDDVLAMIHLQGIEGGGSAKIGSVVPEPATMGAVGIGILALLRRRRR
jgi:hypothetical protein